MRKIIKHGDTNYKKTCPECRCIFTYEKEDITICYTVICPECGCAIAHKETFISPLSEPYGECPWQHHDAQDWPLLHNVTCASCSNKIDPAKSNL